MHTRRSAVEAQLYAPGVHTHDEQRPSVQLDPAGQDIARVPRPSALQIATEVLVWQVVLPGVQLHGRHAPREQDSIAAHSVGVYPRPSGLHTRRWVIEAQLAEPGEHTWAWQRLSTHDAPDPHDDSTQPLPLVLQVRMRRRSRHSRAPGAHTCGAHMRSGVQNCAAGQSTSVTQSTHTAREASHTWSSVAHSRDERQGSGAGRQLLRTQTLPVVQSGSLTQSTHTAREVSQTCPGHIRDDMHATAGAQRFAWQTGVAPPHCAAVMHSTHTLRTRSHTPRAQSRLERQVVGMMGMSAGTSGSVAVSVGAMASSGVTTTSGAIASSGAIAPSGTTGLSMPGGTSVVTAPSGRGGSLLITLGVQAIAKVEQRSRSKGVRMGIFKRSLYGEGGVGSSGPPVR